MVDVGHATDTPLCDVKKDGDIRLGGGPILCRGSVNHPVLVARLEKEAHKADVEYQMAIDPRQSGTDADALIRQRGGIPCASLGLPLRYMHSPVETFHLDDLDRMVNLIVAFLSSLEANESFHVRID